jgi:DNA-binding response OmpR family regulator
MTRTAASSLKPQPILALLVDPDPDTRSLYRDHLRLSAFRVEEAADGREALAKALTNRPDIVITDTRLPGINGFDLIVLLRRDPATHTIPVIVVTPDADAGNLAYARRVGADAVLTKPCLPDCLLAEIRRRVDGSGSRVQTAERSREPLRSGRADQTTASPRRFALSHAYQRHSTMAPLTPPPHLICPQCDEALEYQRSHIGGVSDRHPEQWDYFECSKGCGTFQYRHRTRKLRSVS